MRFDRASGRDIVIVSAGTVSGMGDVMLGEGVGELVVAPGEDDDICKDDDICSGCNAAGEIEVSRATGVDKGKMQWSKMSGWDERSVANGKTFSWKMTSLDIEIKFVSRCNSL